MTTPRDPDRLIHAFILEGEEQLEDQVYDAVRAEIEQKRQRVVIGPWRTPIMNKIVGFGLAAAAVVAAVLIGAQLLGSPGGGIGGPGDEPTPTPEPASPSEAPPSAEPSTSAFLPEGPFLWPDPADPLLDPLGDGPLITVTIPASEWMYEGYLIKGDEVDDLPESALAWTSTTAGIHVYEDPCQWEYDLPDPPSTTADQIAAALAAQPSRDASDPVDVTVGGYPGKMVTLHVPDDAAFPPGGGFADCFRGVYASYTLEGRDADGTVPWRNHQGPGQIDTFWIVDVDGAIVIINAMYRADTPPDRIEEMRAIAESATFETP